MGRTYLVDGVVYETQRALLARIKEIEHAQPVGDDLTLENTRYMVSLLQTYHPTAEQKLGVGVCRMWLERTPYNNTCFFLERIDGTTTDFSYTKCLKQPSERQVFDHAARAAVADQVIAFKCRTLAQGPQICPYTGDALDATCHVDHVAPRTFQALLDQFLRETGVDWRQVKIQASRDGNMTREFDDVAFKDRWAQWHAAHADLRLLSRTGNLSHAKRQQENSFP